MAPQIRVRTAEVNLLYSENGEGDAGSESGSDAGSDAGSDEESDGMTTTIEGKISSRVACLPQLVAMNVVSSFIEHNLHRAIVPSILICKHHQRPSIRHETSAI